MAHRQFVIAGLYLLFFSPTLFAEDWPQFQGPLLSGVSKEKIVPWTETPKTLWSYLTGAGWSSPVVAGGRVYLFHRVRDVETLTCLDAKAGKEIWSESYPTSYRDSFGFDEGPRSTPVIDLDDKCIVTLGAEGKLTGWELSSGKILWSKELQKLYPAKKIFFGIGTSPILANRKILVNVGSKGASVVAFQPRTGEELWKSGQDEVSYSSPVLARVRNKDSAIFFTRDGLLVLDPRDGKVIASHPWRPRNPNSVSAASPIVKGDQIFLTASYGLGAVLLDLTKADSPSEIWKSDEVLSAHYNTPILFDDHLIGIDGRQEYGAKLACIDWASGKLLWAKSGFGCANLIRVDNLLLALTEKGELVLIEANSKEYLEKGRVKILQTTCRAAAALSSGLYYARDEKQLVCIELMK
ncbi:PQQ-like beta-propeller repeat protein [Telmatocola sphagniphila]|uniref:PQQ-like beta-propeller repeat protein n=1 Tax=Telmatocola sphagniphila TaxID=1123043 RepID=A0A8E6B3S6_9BACT|nr:PQQ-binding-like beta-propeller repeat protein [Telmatocola sphagniphila]QVL30018.1 PQQ-like beta-propeller repeat protein [Telmatocola sphagniphila]